MSTDSIRVNQALLEIANLLQLQDANPHRVQAYRTAAQTTRGMPQTFFDSIRAGNAGRARGIGPGLGGKIAEILNTGTCAALNALRRQTAPASAFLLTVPGLGPSRARRIAAELDVRTVVQLQRACNANKVQQLVGLGPSTENKILDALTGGRVKGVRFARADVRRQVDALVRYLRAGNVVERVVIAGSYRRGLSSIGDIDVLVESRSATAVLERFARYPKFVKLLSRGNVRGTALLDRNLKVDLRVVAPASIGAALVYFTGPKAHNIELRRLARSRGLKLNEYGVFRGATRIGGATEESVYQTIGVSMLSPRQRDAMVSLRRTRRTSPK